MDGQHSPFGLIGQIKEKTGYTHDYILWGVSWLVFLMEMADAPKYVKKRPAITVDSAADAAGILGNRAKIID